MDFSVIIPTYNRSKYLRIALDSVLRQKKVSIEVILGDDCSTDGTKKLIESLNDKRIKHIRHKHRLGSSMNMQKCFLKAKGNFIFTLGDDDFILDEYALYDLKKLMEKHSLGMAKIGVIGYDTSPYKPYQTLILSTKTLIYKPKQIKHILTHTINFGLGYFSGLTFDNKRLNKDLLNMNHVCYPDHMCLFYHASAYDLITKFGIGYLPKHFVVGRLSLELIPLYFNITRHRRLFMEEPIELIRPFVFRDEYIQFKKSYLRSQMILLPNIKYFSNVANYCRVILRMLQMDNSLLLDYKFLFWTVFGFLPNFIIHALRIIKMQFDKPKIVKIIEMIHYREKVLKIFAIK